MNVLRPASERPFIQGADIRRVGYACCVLQRYEFLLGGGYRTWWEIVPLPIAERMIGPIRPPSPAPPKTAV